MYENIFKDINSFKVVDVKENSDVSATVTIEENTKSGVKNSVVELEKLQEQWKVSIKK